MSREAEEFNGVEHDADQRLVDAMIRAEMIDDQATIDARMLRVRNAISGDEQEVSLESAPGRTGRLRWARVVQAAIGGAGAIAAVLIFSVMLRPVPVQATAILQRAHDSEIRSSPGEHRYQLEIHPPDGMGHHPVLSGVLYVRDGEMMRFDLTQPDGSVHVWGMDDQGPWEKPPRREARRSAHPRWPRWLEGESQALLVDTMPGLLGLVLAGYDAEVIEEDEDDALSLLASQQDPSERGPDEVLVRLNKGGDEVRELELRWNRSSDHRRPGSRDHPFGHGSGMGDKPPRDGPRGRRGMAPPRSDHPKGRGGPEGKSRRPPPPPKGMHPPEGHRGGPRPVPLAAGKINFKRVDSGPVSEDWYKGPEVGSMIPGNE